MPIYGPDTRAPAHSARCVRLRRLQWTCDARALRINGTSGPTRGYAKVERRGQGRGEGLGEWVYESSAAHTILEGHRGQTLAGGVLHGGLWPRTHGLGCSAEQRA